MIILGFFQLAEISFQVVLLEWRSEILLGTQEWVSDFGALSLSRPVRLP